MAEFTLALANKSYSSWSLRAWLAMKRTGVPFEEVVIPLRQSDTRTEILKYSPSAKLPVLIHGDVTVWDTSRKFFRAPGCGPRMTRQGPMRAQRRMRCMADFSPCGAACP